MVFFLGDIMNFVSFINQFIMEVITIDSDAFKEIMRKLDTIYQDANSRQHLVCALNSGEVWVDSIEVSDMLNISIRTLQRLRKEGLLKFSYVRRRCRYKVSDVCELLDNKTIQCDYEHIHRFKEKYLVPQSVHKTERIPNPVK